nr:hypothetical protein [Kibdelosporangium sp. MJ126-NF4]CEL23359.1 hypothetical protein [Kibdelosporangium sp. MJ126-NF4]CTQ96905.1 hypothetical protein [Kibdelosporangium sp. MJ126-NF4]
MSHHHHRHGPGDRRPIGSTTHRVLPGDWLRADNDSDDNDPDTVARAYARQADELAAIVETLMRDERDRHATTMRTLQTLAASLGEQHGELDELAARLADGEREVR